MTTGRGAAKGDRLRSWRFGLVVVVVIAAVVASVWWAINNDRVDGQSAIDFVLVGLFGALIAVGELVSRYRDAPRRVLASGGATMYIAINIAAAIAALLTIRIFGWEFGLSGDEARWTQVFVAGFGAMAMFRSSVMIVTVGDAEIAAGPAALLGAYLDAADRAVDRQRAWYRATETADYMEDVDFELAKEALPSFIMTVLQNVSAEEAQTLGSKIRALDVESDMSDRAKALNLGLLLINMAGPDVLDVAVRSLDSEIKRGDPSEQAAAQATSTKSSAGGTAEDLR
jgi:hypothetical protein